MSFAPPPIDNGAQPSPMTQATKALSVERSALTLTLAPLRPFLDDPTITEVCINRPGELHLETVRGWRREVLPSADFSWCLRLAKLIAHYTRQRVDEESPLLSASLPRGERVQLVVPPATTPQTVAITIRRPANDAWSVAELAERGLFRATRAANDTPDAAQKELTRLLEQREYVEFMKLAVASRQNILVSGPTGSGKTTFTKALIREIPPNERLITIEDAKELVLDEHPNHVRLFYSKDDKGVARVTPKQLLESCLRMRPDRILLAELRAEEAFDYLRNVNSGHPGSITSVHASSAELAFEQLVLLIKQSVGGQELARADIKQLLYLLIDVVVQFGVSHHQRFIHEIWYGPDRKRQVLREGW
jgi:type IV secretion system protein VirB11